MQVALREDKADGSHGWVEGCPFFSAGFSKERGDITKAIANIRDVSSYIIVLSIGTHYAESNVTQVWFLDGDAAEQGETSHQDDAARVQICPIA